MQRRGGGVGAAERRRATLCTASCSGAGAAYSGVRRGGGVGTAWGRHIYGGGKGMARGRRGAVGSGPRYQILSHVFACCSSKKKHGHARIARETCKKV